MKDRLSSKIDYAARRQRIIDLLMAGFTYTEVARRVQAEFRFKCTRSAVSSVAEKAKKRGIIFPRFKPTNPGSHVDIRIGRRSGPTA